MNTMLTILRICNLRPEALLPLLRQRSAIPPSEGEYARENGLVNQIEDAISIHKVT
jgi:hypothetical protein